MSRIAPSSRSKKLKASSSTTESRTTNPTRTKLRKTSSALGSPNSTASKPTISPILNPSLSPTTQPATLKAKSRSSAWNSRRCCRAGQTRHIAERPSRNSWRVRGGNWKAPSAVDQAKKRVADLERQLGGLKEGGSANLQKQIYTNAIKLDVARLTQQIPSGVKVYTIVKPTDDPKAWATTKKAEVYLDPTGSVNAKSNAPNKDGKPETAGKTGDNEGKANADKGGTSNEPRTTARWTVKLPTEKNTELRWKVEPRSQNNPDLEKRIDMMEKKLDMLMEELKRSRTPATGSNNSSP